MKRFVYLLLSLALILSLSAPVLADSEPGSAAQEAKTYVYLSEDLQTVTYNDKTYVRFNEDYLYDGFSYTDHTVILTAQQQEVISSTKVTGVEDIALRVQLSYYDGVDMYISFIREDLYEQYQQLLETDTVCVDFGYPEDNTVEIKLDRELMEEDIFFEEDRSGATYFEVNVHGSDLSVKRGRMLYRNDQFYYFDYAENKTTNTYIARAKVWHITDEAACAKLEAAADAYYGEGLGFFEDQDFSDIVARVILIIMFVALPLIVLVLFLILAIRAKKPMYKRMFWHSVAWSGVILIFVSIIVAAVEFA